MAESPKVETRLGKILRGALDAYMADKHLTNESEILRSVLGQFLEKEGYLARVAEKPGEYKIVDPPITGDPTSPKDQPPRTNGPKIGFGSALLAQPLIIRLPDGGEWLNPG